MEDELEWMMPEVDPADEAWRILRVTLEKARDELDMNLRGTVVSIGPKGAVFSLVCLTSLFEMQQTVALQFLWNTYQADVIQEDLLMDAVAELQRMAEDDE